MKLSRALFRTIMMMLAVSLGACSNQAVVLPSGQTDETSSESTGDDNETQSADTQNSLFLSWDKPSDSVSGYKIYFTESEKKSSGGKLVKTVLKSAGQDSPTSAQVPITSLGQESDSGKEVCFYLVAELGGKSSEPSDSACLTL